MSEGGSVRNRKNVSSSCWVLSVITHDKSTEVPIGRETYLFVGQHQYHSVTQLIFLQHFEELILGLANALSVVAVHNKDDTWNKNTIYQTDAMKNLANFNSRSNNEANMF